VTRVAGARQLWVGGGYSVVGKMPAGALMGQEVDELRGR